MKKAAVVFFAFLLVCICIAAAGESVDESPVGTWYVNRVEINDAVYDVSWSSKKTIFELYENFTGVTYTAQEEDLKNISWLRDRNGDLYLLDAEENNPEKTRMEFEGESLVLRYEDCTYYLEKTTNETATLENGWYVEFYCCKEDGSFDNMDQLIQDSVSVIQSRLEAEGYSGIIVRRIDRYGIVVENPEEMNSNIYNLICNTGDMQFLDADDNVLLEGYTVKTASFYDDDGVPAVDLELTEEARRLFADATTKNIGKKIRIVLDGEPLVEATVQEPILEGSVIISGSYTQDEAMRIATKLNSGVLPLVLYTQCEVHFFSVRGAKEEAIRIIEQEEKKTEDGKRVVLKLGDEEITREEVQNAAEMKVYEMYMASRDLDEPIDTTDPEVIASARSSAVLELKKTLVERVKIKELGLDILTEEEAARASETAASNWEYAKEYIMMFYLSEKESALKDEELEKIIIAKLEELDIHFESYYENAVEEIALAKFKDYLAGDIIISEEETRAEFDRMIAAGEIDSTSDYDSQKEEIYNSLFAARQNEVYDERLVRLVEESNIWED